MLRHPRHGVSIRDDKAPVSTPRFVRREAVPPPAFKAFWQTLAPPARLLVPPAVARMQLPQMRKHRFESKPGPRPTTDSRPGSGTDHFPGCPAGLLGVPVRFRLLLRGQPDRPGARVLRGGTGGAQGRYQLARIPGGYRPRYRPWTGTHADPARGRHVDRHLDTVRHGTRHDLLRGTNPQPQHFLRRERRHLRHCRAQYRQFLDRGWHPGHRPDGHRRQF